MFWIQLVVVTGVILVIAAVVLGAGGSLPDAYREQPELRMPGDRPLTSADVDHIRFPVVFRGYRMSEVDVVLDRLTGELAARDARILELEYKITGTTPAGLTVSVPGATTAGASAVGPGRLAPPARASGTTLSLEKPGRADEVVDDAAPTRVAPAAVDEADDTRDEQRDETPDARRDETPDAGKTREASAEAATGPGAGADAPADRGGDAESAAEPKGDPKP
ncbi:DivIVA domain-containing protein [Embleya sp. NBC_00888]|uniref:DivIVA domain-containing protein n=1 Tax=Embleya sp. NBC_00888 TaxID=2975960 RepID=UPI003866DB30|nr:DivIVA domain-containing protein [Embleya sp. NBC_00888]